MEKLLAIASLGQRAYGRWLFQHLLSGIIVIVGLTIVIAMIISTLLVGGLYVSYITLLHYGVGSHVAMMIIAAAVVLVLALLAFFMFLSFRRLNHMPRTLLKQAFLPSHTAGVLGAFFDGLTTDIR